MTEKQIRYILKNFKQGTTILFTGVSCNQYINLEKVIEAGYTCILLGKDQDYWPYIKNDMLIYTQGHKHNKQCHKQHCKKFIYNKNQVQHAEDREGRVLSAMSKQEEK